jgi:HTH-type transcriptional regulator / antitoxin HigA
MEKMSVALLDKSRYEKLLSDALPVVIRSEQEYRRLLDAAKRLMETPDEKLAPEEGRLLELLGVLIEEYEDRVDPLPKIEPHEMLRHLLEENNLRPGDLGDIMPKSRVSEILSGKRSISKAQAKDLAKRFRVPVDVFL